MLPDIRKNIVLVECPQAWPVCTSGRHNTGAKMITEHWCNDTDRRKSTGEKIDVMILTGERVLGKKLM
jgi:hypothetical protein